MNWIDATGGKSARVRLHHQGPAAAGGAVRRVLAAEGHAGKPAGAIGWWAAKSVTFIDNHDTGPSYPSGGQNHWPFPKATKVIQGYAYILTHPGIPCVYWVHFYDWDQATRQQDQDADGVAQGEGHHLHLGGEHPGRADNPSTPPSSPAPRQPGDEARLQLVVAGHRGRW